MDGELELAVLLSLYRFNDLPSIGWEINRRFVYNLLDPDMTLWSAIWTCLETLTDTGDIWYDGNEGRWTMSEPSPVKPENWIGI